VVLLAAWDWVAYRRHVRSQKGAPA